MRVTLIHNDEAGDQSKQSSTELVELLQRAGHVVRYQAASAANWAAALREPTDVVAVAGGDGTVSRVAKRLAGTGIPLVPLPMGTANNIARTLGLAEEPIEDLVGDWGMGRRVKLHVGTCRGPDAHRPVIEGVGLGLFADFLSDKKAAKTLAGINPAERQVEAALQMLAERAAAATPIAVTGTLDGTVISGRYLMIEAMNIPYIGPNLFLAPDRQPGDGLFDVVMVTEGERARLVEYLHRWQDERARLAVLPTVRGNDLRITQPESSVHVDDEHIAADARHTDMSLALDAGTVDFLVPQPQQR